MPKWLKALLAMVAAGFGLVVVVSFATVLWIRSNKDRLVEEGKASKGGGAEYGRAHDKDACVDEALRQADACGTMEMICEARSKIFLVSCLGESAPEPAFCRGVPKMGEIVATATYLNQACADRGRQGNQRCTRLLQAIPEHCAGRR